MSCENMSQRVGFSKRSSIARTMILVAIFFSFIEGQMQHAGFSGPGDDDGFWFDILLQTLLLDLEVEAVSWRIRGEAACPESE